MTVRQLLSDIKETTNCCISINKGIRGTADDLLMCIDDEKLDREVSYIDCDANVIYIKPY